MVPLSDSTCRNLGVLANAQTRSVQSDVQSGRYSAPISNAWERNVPLSGFTNPESTKTTPSCPKQTHGIASAIHTCIHQEQHIFGSVVIRPPEGLDNKYQKFGEIRSFLHLLVGGRVLLLAWISLPIFRTHPRREIPLG